MSTSGWTEQVVGRLHAWHGSWLYSAVVAVTALVLVGCAAPRAPEEPVDRPEQDAVASSPWAQASNRSTVADGNWQHQNFPGKRATLYAYERTDGRDAVAVRASSSASMLRQAVHIPPAQLSRLRFSWKVPALIAAADLAVREREDSPARVVLAFDGDRSRFSMKDQLLSELAQSLTGEPMPYATLMYVWGNRKPPGSVVVNTRTSRVRKLVMESGPARLGQWLDYERDVRADFIKVFGEEPGALIGIGIMTDTDNTGSQARAWYGPLTFVKTSSGKPPAP